jgi:prophage antirepressor-like protein
MENVTIIKFNAIEERVITLRGEKVLLDSDVAELYGVETKRINEAVANNPDRFPEEYIFELQNTEKQELVKNFDRFSRLKHSSVSPKAFTEKGLYMLATILKSPQAVQTSIAIVETFAKIRELSRTMAELAETSEEVKKKSLMRKSGEIIADMLDEEMKTTDTETSIEFNLALLKVKHTVKKTSKR